MTDFKVEIFEQIDYCSRDNPCDSEFEVNSLKLVKVYKLSLTLRRPTRTADRALSKRVQELLYFII